ncbi:uncharacterized protein LOC113214211 isoform X2 [Frankliniella occidentalis]|nr:uncharacterized protein LOC113214211 isoform X2 [Frankliniella occidentalis]XP_052122710.1 uncharacterized protein LOC113214211 isoform X2 [Frankliniella occidentalis]
MFPEPQFKLMERLQIARKFRAYMTQIKQGLHESWGFSSPSVQVNNFLADKPQAENSDGRSNIVDAHFTPVLGCSLRKRKSSTTKNDGGSSDSGMTEEEDGDSHKSDKSFEIDDDDMTLRISSDSEGERTPCKKLKLSTPTVDFSSTDAPLVNKNVLGKKRKILVEATAAVDELNLENFFNSEGQSQCSAVLSGYKRVGYLERKDRFLIARSLAEWLVNRIENPSQELYFKLRNKIIKLFPREKAKVWYLSPGSEGPQQKNAKGILQNAVKNLKTFLRGKGKIPSKPRKSKKSLPVIIPSVDYSNDEQAATEWLRRNFEPLTEVRRNWRVCARPRLQELVEFKKFKPHEYISKWDEILKLPNSHELITDDFEVLPSIIEAYAPLKDKGNSLMINWNPFCVKLIFLIESGITSLSKKEIRDFQKRLKNASDQNSKDYVILQILPFICKQQGRVKVGRKTLKPSAEESKDAFLQHIRDSSDLDVTIKSRHERASKFGAPVQPYIVVLGEHEDTCRAAYVIVDRVPWKVGGPLAAVDLCFKTCFGLNCHFPPEAMHLWLFVQHYLYNAEIYEDPVIESVISLIDHLNNVVEDDAAS